MSKRSKLPEKGTRMPEIRQSKWDDVLSTYLEAVQKPVSEPAKSHFFSMLLKDLFGVQPGFIEEYVEGIEKYVKVRQKDTLLRGRVDSLFGSLVIEFERDLAKTRGEAEDQLRKYVAVLWAQEAPDQRRPYLGIAADGVAFVIYSPSIPDPSKRDVEPGDVTLLVIEEVDLSRLGGLEAYLWLDRYFVRKEILAPKTENIVKDFGVKSHAFRVAHQGLLSLWRQLRDRPEFAVVYESWEKYLLIVYGSSVADEELFIRHTYLATLAKLMAWCRLTGATTAESGEILSVLEGEFFKKQGIENFLEEDFFSWVAREEAREVGVEGARRLFSLLQKYNLRELSEDVLKSLYQELVDPETRHDLGEYYTPDWLAHRMVRKLLDEKPRASLLDPACGSGTFLYLAIGEKRERLGDSLKTLRHIQESVVGVDIHPLAVIIAKTNYILALGDLLKKRKRGTVTIPIYLADTLKLPERFMKGEQYEITVDSETIYVHSGLLASVPLYDQAIEMAKEFAQQNKGKPISQDRFRTFLSARQFTWALEHPLLDSLYAVAHRLKQFMEAERDTIWAFVLKNIYKPLFLKDTFDVVMGNPPWIAFRFFEPGYQTFLKRQITDEYSLLTGRGELITHLEVALLFFVRSAHLYLKQGGTIAFVLPRSVFSGDQHDDFRQARFGRVGLELIDIWDLERVKPLFKVPSCVLFAQKRRDSKFEYPIRGEEVRGQLQGRNAGLAEAEERLTVHEVEYFLSRLGKRSFWSTVEAIRTDRPSHYAKGFRQGATVVPRAFWFVEVKASSLGFNPSLPPLETAKRARQHAKAPYKGVVLEGNVEKQFLYATLLSTDLLPFGRLEYRLIVLPIEACGDAYNLVHADQARGEGFFHLARWLEQAEDEWQERRSAKAQRIDVLGWLNYRRKLTSQNPQAQYRVLYPTSATYLCASVVRDQRIVSQSGDQEVVAQGFICDHVTYCLETELKDEAYYLVGVLNAPIVDRLIKPMQARGQWGARHIHKKVLELPIPQFDSSKPDHLQLAGIGEACTQKVAQWLETGGPGKVRAIGRLRGMVREMLAEELEEIDRLVKPMLRGD